jgi:hypothetical protein
MNLKMEDQENNEIKILIDALKYTSNIIVDLTNKLTNQEEKIGILENKLNKIQKLSMENNFKLKTIDFDKLNDLIKLNNSCLLNKKKYNQNSSDEISEYIIEKKNINEQINKINNVSGELVEEFKDKSKIDKLIGSIVKRKNLLNQMINDNKDKSILTEYDNNNKKNTKINNDIDFTIKTGTNKSEIIPDTNFNNDENTKSNNFEQDKIISAQNNDLNKANNILKQIRRRGNYVRKM